MRRISCFKRVFQILMSPRGRGLVRDEEVENERRMGEESGRWMGEESGRWMGEESGRWMNEG
jgi:hypothetical protein